ncbi:MAG: tyrosine-type recombinase/integrase, partial [Pirellulaceae bacterium]|nr:tyrosine-type recombinase/integrase [Pirellulaceae bacterium]
DFEGRRAQLEGLGIKEDESGAFRKIIYSKEQLVEQREYLKKTLWQDGSFASRRLFAAILFCMATGARRSEIVRMRRCDFNLVSATPTAIKRLRKARGNLYLKEQEVDLHSDLIPYLEMVMRQMPKDQQAVFVSNDIHLNGEEVDEAKEDWKCGQLGEDFKEALAGSKWQYQTGWHTYRHTLASKMIEDGKDRQEIKSFIGWCSDEMYENYTHLLKRKKRQVVTGAYPEEM